MLCTELVEKRLLIVFFKYQFRNESCMQGLSKIVIHFYYLISFLKASSTLLIVISGCCMSISTVYNDLSRSSKSRLSVRPGQPKMLPDNQKYWCSCPTDNHEFWRPSCETQPQPLLFILLHVRVTKNWDGQPEMVTWLSVGQPFLFFLNSNTDLYYC